ncbi:MULTISPECIES: hypothetical protein [Klebsiella]|uniref:hypothetical protein n=1 Tax=Klebsiella TaxID=570 RepID=UPI001F4ECC35|nr:MULTISPECIES: hypothetical protein [Klebsiella]MCH9421332.1 hypothetical protein [Klebsiella quasipneumoniae]MCJ1873073.1 hypothetical protein [Klebsiella sp. HSTU-Sny5]HCI5982271.1 hypothetical protein [Klebsiella quasipneumoniae subsp. quasipneumoniae]
MDYITEDVLDKVIIDLTYRANKARRARFLIGGSIILIATMLSGFITYRLTSNPSNSSLTKTLMAIKNGFGVSDDGGLREFINKELGQVYESEEDIERLRAENESSIPSEKKINNDGDDRQITQTSNKKEALDNASRLVDFYTKVVAANNGKPINKTDDTYSNLISSIALSAGIVGFLLYILQIAVSFIRYYSRLAELYDSQKTALIASDGNVESAEILMKILSNDHIGLGKEPATLYGKALDVIGEVAKSK